MAPVEGDPARAGAPLDSSSHSWMPFLGSFAPAGYEPAAAPDPLAWSINCPIGMGYSPYMSAIAVGGGGGGGIASGQHYLPVIGTTAPAAQPLTTGETPSAVETSSSARPPAAERDELDLDALAQLEQVQSDLLLQSHAAADADLVRTSTTERAEEHFPATATVAAPNGSSPPFDLFALLRSPSPVHPFAAATGTAAGVPFGFDPWGPAAIMSPIKLHPSSSLPQQQQQQQLSTSSVTNVERGRQLQVGVKSELLPATVGHAASFLASADWAFTQAYLLSHCELVFRPSSTCVNSWSLIPAPCCRYLVSCPPRFDRVFACRERLVLVRQRRRRRLGSFAQSPRPSFRAATTLFLPPFQLALSLSTSRRFRHGAIDSRLGEPVPLARPAREPPSVLAACDPVLVSCEPRSGFFEQQQQRRRRRCGRRWRFGCVGREQYHGDFVGSAWALGRRGDLGCVARARSVCREASQRPRSVRRPQPILRGGRRDSPRGSSSLRG